METSDIQNPAEWLLRAFGGSTPTVAGITVTPLRAMGVATVYACVRVLADTISTLPLEVHQRRGNQRDVATSHRLFTALSRKPNPDMNSVDARAAIMSNLAMRSNGYAEILRDSDGDIVGFYPIETRRVQPYKEEKTLRMRYRLTDRPGVLFKPNEILHFKNNTFDGLIGGDMTQTVRDVIALAIALQDNACKFFGNGSRPSAVLEHPANLSEEAQERLRNQFEQMSSGVNLYRMLVLEEGLKFQKQRSENKDSQFLEAKEAQNLEICRVFGVPPHKVGIISGSQRSAEEDNIAFVADVIRPHCVRLEMEFDTKLFTEEELDQGYCARFDLEDLMRGNTAALYNGIAVGRQWGLLSQNDGRKKLNLPPIKDGDVYLQPLNMVDSTQATAILLKKGNSAEQTEDDSQKKA